MVLSKEFLKCMHQSDASYQALLLILHPPISAQPIQARGGAAGCSGDKNREPPWRTRPETEQETAELELVGYTTPTA
jgi:hypothetical protein